MTTKSTKEDTAPSNISSHSYGSLLKMMYLMVKDFYRFNDPEFDLSQKTLIQKVMCRQTLHPGSGDVRLQGTEEGFLDVFLTLVAFPTFRFKSFLS